MTELVAILYIVGAATTVYGVTAAYRRAKKQKADYDAIKIRNDQLLDPTPEGVVEVALSDGETAASDLRSTSARNQAEVTELLREVGVTDPPPSLEDLRLPIEYWSRRAALADALVVFKRDGLLALGGVVLSTVASVMSLYA